MYLGLTVAGLALTLVLLTAGYTRPDLSHAETEPLLPPIDLPTEGKAKMPPAPAVPPPPSSPSSPEEDPDMLGTVHCKSAHSSAARIVQYALMIDAGSTGSRIHVYKFNNCGSAPSYEYEVFAQTKPGLSSYATDPVGAAKSLDVLLDRAKKVVPASLHSCTPVAVKATAGLRLLGASQSTAILAAVHKRLEDVYAFPLHGGDNAVTIMDGSDEGVFAWITANYLLHAIGADAASAGATAAGSHAVLDLGGASTQIVFEPAFSKEGGLVDGEHKYTLQFGGRTHTLYQHSYLGYGLMRARKHVHQLVDFMSSIRPSSSPDAVPNPCLAQGTKRVVEVEDPRNADLKHNVTMSGADVGSFESCNRVIELVMAKDAWVWLSISVNAR
jgi:guanosine-diphosphatase